MKKNTWDKSSAALREKHPSATDGILFCLHKLSEAPQLRIPDMRAEASAFGITLSGRALHSARVLLGLSEAAKPRRSRARASNGTGGHRLVGRGDGAVGGFEHRLLSDGVTLKVEVLLALLAADDSPPENESLVKGLVLQDLGSDLESCFSHGLRC